MGEPMVARQPAPATSEPGQEVSEQKGIERNWSQFSLYAPGQPPPKPPGWNGVQAKLTIGQPNDPYEQEADRVAEQVMSMPDSATHQPVQREAMPEEEIQTKPLAATITPLVQREAMPEEEEVQTKTLGNSTLQREAMPEEEEPVQAKALGQADFQREAFSEEGENPIQTKGSSDSSLLTPHSSLETQLNSTQGSGSPLPNEVRTFMEPRFSADLSQVRVHTGSNAIQMNRDLNAQAFTHKQDIYFGAGKAPANDALTAHELTHVVQQTGVIQPKLSIQRRSPADKAQAAKVAQMRKDFNTAVKQSEWQMAAEVLNGFNREDIIARLKKLNTLQIIQIKDGAIKNPRVGSNAQVVQVISDYSATAKTTTVETVSFSVSDGPYGWDVSYDIWTVGKTVFVRLRINVVAGVGVTTRQLSRLKKIWEKAQEKWSGKYKLVDSSDTTNQYTVRIMVQFVQTDVDQTVTVQPGPARSNMTTWDTKDDKHAASHEIGHMLGNKDEYADPAVPSRTVTNSTSVMNTNTGKVKKAHYQSFATWLSSKTGKTIVVQ